MTSRLTIAALVFSVLTTASLAFAGTVSTSAAPRAVQLERVVITGHRI